MNEEYIPFLERITVKGALYFILTKRPMEARLFERLPQQRFFMALLNPKKDGTFKLCTDKESLLCGFDEEGCLLVRGVRDLDFHTHNVMMRYGIPVSAEETVVEVRAQALMGIKALFTADGIEDLNDNPYDKKEAAEKIKGLIYALDVAASAHGSYTEGEEEEEEPYQPNKKLGKLLNLAENYANLESDLAAKAAQKNRVAYKRIEPLDYERSDRTAYAFITETFPAEDYRIGVQVQIDGRQDQPYTAEVIEVGAGEDDKEPYIGLLFNGQVGLDAFEDSGWISLSFSTVIRDVQLASIENIRKGNAAAKYMDAVLGKYEPAGFDEIDLSALERELNARKRPPTESQMRAIKNGICSRDIYLVMGPPGTGKTTVILEWVRYFVQHGKRVLISSQNNKAVDNVLARLAEEPEINMIRIGSEAKVEAVVRPYLFENKVAVARMEIAEKTANNLAIANTMRERWKALQEKLPAFAKELARYEQDEANFQQDIDASVLVHGKAMEACHTAYQEVRAAVEQQRHIVEKRYTHIKDMPTSGFTGFFTPFRRFLERFPMRREVREYDELREKERLCAAAYNEAKAQYDTFFQSLYARFLPLQASASYCREVYRSLQEQGEQAASYGESLAAEDEAACDSHAWGFFSCSFPSMRAESVAAYAAYVTAQLQLLERFISHLKEWQEYNESKQNYSLQHMILESVNLVGATCIGVSSQKRFSDLKFDVTIIDEAGQIQIHNALVPMSVSNKLIMLGDHQQIPPSTDKELVNACKENGVDTELLEMSFFEKLYEEISESNKTMLDLQFRMPPEIAAIISHEFYGGAYRSKSDWKEELLSSFRALSQARLVVIDTSDEEHRLEQETAERGIYNALEAVIVMRLVRGMQKQAEDGFNVKELGIISAYKAQVKKIREQLEDVLDEEARRETVATLDSFQGQERDIIIYSFTRSSSKASKKSRIGFLKELRRLNVAMTRCKKMLILIGDMRFLTSCEYVEHDDDGNVLYKRSEAPFSAFMRALLDGVKNGIDGRPPGEKISYAEFDRRMEEIEHDS